MNYQYNCVIIRNATFHSYLINCLTIANHYFFLFCCHISELVYSKHVLQDLSLTGLPFILAGQCLIPLKCWYHKCTFIICQIQSTVPFEPEFFCFIKFHSMEVTKKVLKFPEFFKVPQSYWYPAIAQGPQISKPHSSHWQVR